MDVAGKLSKADRIVPLELRLASETARKDSVLALDELSRRIIFGTVGPYTMTNPEDVLPPMPLRPMPPVRPADADSNPSRTSVADNLQGTKNNGTFQRPTPNSAAKPVSFKRASPRSASSSQTSLDTPLAPTPQRNNIYMPTSWTLPEFNTSQDLVRTRPSSSATALSWMKDIFPVRPTRPYYDITPLKPTPPVVPTFTYDTDAIDILEEGRRAAEKLWEAAECAENDRLRLRLQAHSAPIPQGPWKSLFGDDEDDELCQPQLPPPQQRRTPSPAPDDDDSQTFLRPVLPGATQSSAQGGKRIRSEPTLEFSVVIPRFRRHVSSPETHTN